MEVTAREAKHIERLRKQLRLWPRTRWLVLLIGIMAAVSCVVHVWGAVFFWRNHPRSVDGFLFLANAAGNPEAKINALGNAISSIPDEQLTIAYVAFFVVMGIFLAFLSLGCFAIAFRDWNGNVKKTLLLKLYDNAIRQQPDASKLAGSTETKAGT
jgi:predicted permease